MLGEEEHQLVHAGEEAWQRANVLEFFGRQVRRGLLLTDRQSIWYTASTDRRSVSVAGGFLNMRPVKSPAVRREEILAVASELFRSLGYQHTTVEAIIRQAGIAKGTFYYYFPSKADVLAAIAD